MFPCNPSPVPCLLLSTGSRHPQGRVSAMQALNSGREFPPWVVLSLRLCINCDKAAESDTIGCRLQMAGEYSGTARRS